MLEVSGVAHLSDRSARRRSIETLADLPRQTQIAGVALAVAAREIDADRIAPDQAGGCFHGNVAAASAEGYDQFDLELEVGCERRIGNARAVEHDRIARLLKEERRVALVGFLHFPDVIEIVAADAIDAANRKEAAACDRGFGRRDCWKQSVDVHAFWP